MKTITNLLVVLILLFSTPFCVAQNVEIETEKAVKVRPFRIGPKLVFPNLIDGNVEYVTPLLNKKLAVSLDYSTINSDWFIENNNEGRSSENVNFSYLERG